MKRRLTFVRTLKRSLYAAPLSFALACGDDEVTIPPSLPTGTLTVSTASVGSAVDVDGYTVVLDGTITKPIGAADSVAVGITVGQHDMRLTGLADNCAVIGENPVSVTVREEETIGIAFNVACPPFYDYIAFISAREGRPNIFVMESNGSNPTNLTPDTTRSYGYPAWAPDATRIAFTSDGDIWVLNTATMQLTRLTDGAGAQLCAWSPDGTKIAYDSKGDIYVMNADGSDPINLTPGPARGFEPAWSPNGSQIAFSGGREGEYISDIWLMEADGSNPVRLTDHQVGETAWDPAWSPDGNRIAFARTVPFVDPRIWVMEADGSNLVNLTPYEQYYHAWRPAWSPDGTRIAFWAYKGFAQPPERSYEIYVMDADGSNEVNLTNHAGYDVNPTWSPGQ